MILGLLAALALYGVLRLAAVFAGIAPGYDVLAAGLTTVIVYPILHALANRGGADG